MAIEVEGGPRTGYSPRRVELVYKRSAEPIAGGWIRIEGDSSIEDGQLYSGAGGNEPSLRRLDPLEVPLITAEKDGIV
jgi:hypothetical protein